MNFTTNEWMNELKRQVQGCSVSLGVVQFLLVVPRSSRISSTFHCPNTPNVKIKIATLSNQTNEWNNPFYGWNQNFQKWKNTHLNNRKRSVSVSNLLILNDFFDDLKINKISGVSEENEELMRYKELKHMKDITTQQQKHTKKQTMKHREMKVYLSNEIVFREMNKRVVWQLKTILQVDSNEIREIHTDVGDNRGTTLNSQMTQIFECSCFEKEIVHVIKRSSMIMRNCLHQRNTHKISDHIDTKRKKKTERNKDTKRM
jgi:hypothetical protein